MIPVAGLKPAHPLRILGPEDDELKVVNIYIINTLWLLVGKTLGAGLDSSGLAWTPYEHRPVRSAVLRASSAINPR
jgi:hypothetical protein